MRHKETNIGIAVAALVFAWRKIYRPIAQCEPGQVCADPGNRRGYKIAFWIVAAFVAVSAAFPYGAEWILVG